MSQRVAALIVAAGESRRMGGLLPKQYQMLNNKSLLRRSVEAFQHHTGIGSVQVVVNPAHQELYQEHVRGLSLPPAVHGGTTRQESVRLGLAALAASNPPDVVLIHDAARPNVSSALITELLEALNTYSAVIPALPVIDTLKHVEDQKVIGTIARKKLYRAQTPQGFHFAVIEQAHRLAAGQGDEFTDDAAVAEYAGMEVTIMAGSEHNYKITTIEDMRDAQALLRAQYETRVGYGVDVHRLVPHDPETPPHQRVLTLCGVPIPFESRLEGHSDADAGLHALVDALLGAMGEGDIGMHFSPSDPKWRGADSSRFVLHAYQLLRQRRGQIVHADITIVGEKPYISPHRQAMREMLSKLLDIELSRISVKATTTEKMGFTGRGEGILAHAVVTVLLPIEAFSSDAVSATEENLITLRQPVSV